LDGTLGWWGCHDSQGARPDGLARSTTECACGSSHQDIRRILEDSHQQLGTGHVSVAVRSSGAAEDLPDASFAGEHASFLNVASLCRRIIQNCLGLFGILLHGSIVLAIASASIIPTDGWFARTQIKGDRGGCTTN
jgi:hypothetical protein